MKIVRGFARCPVSGCTERRVLFVVTEKTQYGTAVFLWAHGMTKKVPSRWQDRPGQLSAFREAGVYCEDHQTGMNIRALKATRSTSPCSDKCLHAIGPECECECAGKNHGKRAMAALR